jgi:Domain of unknown function (DUF4062)
MEKRYQVFLSSTFKDLEDERRLVVRSLQELYCIPAGMEFFPAEEKQWKLIKRVMDDSDYYILIIGARYGSLTPSGISYTEKEFRYAKTTRKRVLAFVHEDPGSLPVNRSDTHPKLQKNFRNSARRYQ